MKKVLENTLGFLGLLSIALGALFFLCLIVMAIKPLRDLTLSAFFGCIYRKVGETVMTANGKTETLAIYKAEKKPFLIVGPCSFHDYDEKYKIRDCWEDFFFVNPKEVIRTCVDKGGDTWVRLPWLLFISDDMTSRDRVRMPYWDDLKHEQASVRYDEATASYVYSLWINSPEEPVSFAIPAKFFAPDLRDAPDDT